MTTITDSELAARSTARCFCGEMLIAGLSKKLVKVIVISVWIARKESDEWLSEVTAYIEKWE
jgi:hypothetical protein